MIPMNLLHFPAIRAVEIRLRAATIRMTHQRLDGSKIIPIIQGVVTNVHRFWFIGLRMKSLILRSQELQMLGVTEAIF